MYDYWNLIHNDSNANPAAIKQADDEDTTTAKSTCKLTGNALTWFACPAINLVSSAIGKFSDGIQQKLADSGTHLNNPGDDINSSIQSGWERALPIADVFLAIAFIIVIIATAVGGQGNGLFSNYNAKKMLPRLIIAAIAVHISFYICMALVDIVQILGSGINDALLGSNGIFKIKSGYSAANMATHPIADLVGSGADVAIGVTAIVLSVKAIGLGPIIMLAICIILPILLGILLIYLLIQVRLAILMILVIVSPIAFVLLIFPNTQKWFSKWGSMFMKLLAIYPMFILVRAVCEIMSYILVVQK